jgi:hypothetical protein
MPQAALERFALIFIFYKKIQENISFYEKKNKNLNLNQNPT